MDEQVDFGLLNSQTDRRFGDRRYGRLGSIAKNGCGMIALYNIERAADEQTRFEPFYAARKQIKTNLFGLLGTRPSSIAKNLRNKGFTVSRIPRKHAADAPQYDGVIVLYWQFFSAHYVAGIGKDNGVYTFYNQFRTPIPMKLGDFTEHLRKNRLHTVCIWGIRFPDKSGE